MSHNATSERPRQPGTYRRVRATPSLVRGLIAYHPKRARISHRIAALTPLDRSLLAKTMWTSRLLQKLTIRRTSTVL